MFGTDIQYLEVSIKGIWDESLGMRSQTLFLYSRLPVPLIIALARGWSNDSPHTDDRFETSGPSFGSGVTGRFLVHRYSWVCRVSDGSLYNSFCQDNVCMSSVSLSFNRILVESLPSAV